MSTYEQLDSGIIIPSDNKKSGYRADAWINANTGQGDPNVDSSVGTTFSAFDSAIAKQTLESLYKHDWLSRKICLRPAKDATRKFIQCHEQDIHKQVEKKFKKIKARQKIKTAIAWSRLFGGAGIAIITDDPDASKPLDFNGKDKIVDIEVYDR